MQKRLVNFVACALVSVGIASVAERQTLVAQEPGKTAKAEKAEGAKKTAKAEGRLPANYAKIGVNDDQRKKIYEIQGKYDKDIAALQKQIADLKAKEQAEVEAVLTVDQKKALQTANEESKKKAAEKKKDGDKGNEKKAEGDK